MHLEYSSLFFLTVGILTGDTSLLVLVTSAFVPSVLLELLPCANQGVGADACVCHNYCVQLLFKKKKGSIFKWSPALNYSVCITHKQRLVK